MLNIKVIFISSILAFTCAKVLIDDIDVEANREYLDISASIDRTSFDEPVANIDVVLKKDVDHLLVKVSLCAKINDEYKEIVPTMEFNPCNKNEIPDELVKFAMGEIEKHGNLTLTCPLNSGHYVIQNFKLGDSDATKSMGSGQFRVDVGISIDDTNLMTKKFYFHCEG